MVQPDLSSVRVKVSVKVRARFYDEYGHSSWEFVPIHRHYMAPSIFI